MKLTPEEIDDLWVEFLATFAEVHPVCNDSVVELLVRRRMRKHEHLLRAEFRRVLQRSLNARCAGVPLPEPFLIVCDMYTEFLSHVVRRTWPEATWTRSMRFLLVPVDPISMAERLEKHAALIRRKVLEN